MSKAKKFDTTSCGTCGHPKGIHNPQCWSYGLVEPKCRQKCMKFKRNNLAFIEQKYEESRKKR